jgi:hypothetical protein
MLLDGRIRKGQQVRIGVGADGQLTFDVSGS